MNMASLPTGNAGMPSFPNSMCICQQSAVTTAPTLYLNANGSGATATLGNAKSCAATEHWNISWLEMTLAGDSTSGVKATITFNLTSDDSVLETHIRWFFGKGSYFLPLGISGPNQGAAYYVKLAITNADGTTINFRLAGVINTPN